VSESARRPPCPRVDPDCTMTTLSSHGPGLSDSVASSSNVETPTPRSGPAAALPGGLAPNHATSTTTCCVQVKCDPRCPNIKYYDTLSEGQKHTTTQCRILLTRLLGGCRTSVVVELDLLQRSALRFAPRIRKCFVYPQRVRLDLLRSAGRKAALIPLNSASVCACSKAAAAAVGYVSAQISLIADSLK
jgi:hypothetical protein